MFLVARRTGTVLDDIRFVECVRPAILFQVTGLTFSVDRIKRDTMTKTIAQHGLEYWRRECAAADERSIVALRTVFGKPGVTARNFSRIKKCFASARLKKQDSS